MKEEDTSDFVAFKQVFACMSIAGSVIVLASLCVCERWRSRMPPLKWILTAIGVFNLLSAINYLYYDHGDDTTCRVQASMLQFFELGSTMYAFVMAMETHILLGIITNSLERLRFTMGGRRTVLRHLCYHAGVGLFGAATVIWINVTGSYGGNGTWCWIELAYYRLYLFYIPTWLSILAILYLDVEVVRVVYKSYQLLRTATEGMPQHSLAESAEEDNSIASGRVVERSQSPAHSRLHAMNAKMLRVFLRMVLYPLCLLLLVMPGSVVRVIQAGNYNIDATLFRILSIARNMCDPSFGTLNVVMWVFSDNEVLMEWREVIQGMLLPLKGSTPGSEPSKLQQMQSTNRGDCSTTTDHAMLAAADLSEGLMDYPERYSSHHPLYPIESTPIVDPNNSLLEYINNEPVSSAASAEDSASDFPEIHWTN